MCVGHPEGGRVEAVECLGTKLQALVFRNAEILVDRQVEVGDPRSPKQVAPGVAVSERRVGRECGGVEPAVEGALALVKERTAQ